MAFTPTEEAQLRAVITAFESGKTISEILASTEVFTTDVLEVVQSAVSKKATVAQIITLVNSELGISTISSKLSGIESGAQVNVIESIKVNNTVLPISSKSVNVTVPTQPSDIGAQAALGFTPEQAGVAQSLITALKNGVSTEGDTLKKLYDLIVASFSEVHVATIAARDEYNITKLPTNVFVLDDGDSKWALYRATTTGTNAAYVKLSDPDLLNAVMTASQIAISYESVDDVNRFTDALKAKLDAFTANLTADQLQIINTVPLVCSDEKTDLTASTDVPVIRFVFQTAQIFTKIVGELNTAAAGGTFTVVAKKNGVSFLSTPLTFDGGENTTRTASVPFVFTTPTVSFSVGDYVEIFITAIGAVTPGKGLKIYLM